MSFQTLATCVDWVTLFKPVKVKTAGHAKCPKNLIIHMLANTGNALLTMRLLWKSQTWDRCLFHLWLFIEESVGGGAGFICAIKQSDPLTAIFPPAKGCFRSSFPIPTSYSSVWLRRETADTMWAYSQSDAMVFVGKRFHHISGNVGQIPPTSGLSWMREARTLCDFGISPSLAMMIFGLDEEMQYADICGI